MKGFLTFLGGLALLPLCAGSAYSFLTLLAGFKRFSTLLLIFSSGFAVYFLFELIFKKPLRTYVLGHELTHAITSLFFGDRPKKFKISKRGGSVTLTRSNFIISLSPYIVPLYTCCIMLLYYGIHYFYDISRAYPAYVGLVGFSLAFHIRLTLFAILQGQPDIQSTGIFFSLVFIALMNFIIVAGLLAAFFPDMIQMKSFFAALWHTACAIYAGAWALSRQAARFLDRTIGELL